MNMKFLNTLFNQIKRIIKTVIKNSGLQKKGPAFLKRMTRKLSRYTKIVTKLVEKMCNLLSQYICNNVSELSRNQVYLSIFCSMIVSLAAPSSPLIICATSVSALCWPGILIIWSQLQTKFIANFIISTQPFRDLLPIFESFQKNLLIHWPFALRLSCLNLPSLESPILTLQKWMLTGFSTWTITKLFSSDQFNDYAVEDATFSLQTVFCHLIEIVSIDFIHGYFPAMILGCSILACSPVLTTGYFLGFITMHRSLMFFNMKYSDIHIPSTKDSEESDISDIECESEHHAHFYKQCIPNHVSKDPESSQHNRLYYWSFYRKDRIALLCKNGFDPYSEDRFTPILRFLNLPLENFGVGWMARFYKLFFQIKSFPFIFLDTLTIIFHRKADIANDLRYFKDRTIIEPAQSTIKAAGNIKELCGTTATMLFSRVQSAWTSEPSSSHVPAA